MHSMVTIINEAVLHTHRLLRESLNAITTHIQNGNYVREWSFNLIVVIILQYTHVSI